VVTDVRTPSASSKPKHYTDSNARFQLRETVMSPEKFDEALEFGFPITTANAAVNRTTSAASKPDQSVDSGLEELSLSDSAGDDNDDEEEYEEEDDDDDYPKGPLTPNTYQETTHPSIIRQHNISIDSGVALPIHLTSITKGSIRSITPEFTAAREMTLKLSLTRPDLRAPEEKLYSLARGQASGVHLAEDPLKLEALTVCEDHTGANGAFAVRERSLSGKKGLGRVWKTLRMQ
jgi:hypothetical protein